MAKQDFGYSATSIASTTKGGIGGSVQRSTRPAFFVARAEVTRRAAIRIGDFCDHAVPTGRRIVCRLFPEPAAGWQRTPDWVAQVTLGDKSVSLLIKPGSKADGASFDRFEMFTSQASGQMVRIYLDDLTYTAGN